MFVWGMFGMVALAAAGYLAADPVKAWHLRRELHAAERRNAIAVAPLLAEAARDGDAAPRPSAELCRAAVSEIRRMTSELAALHPAIDSPDRSQFLRRLAEQERRLLLLLNRHARRERHEALAAEYRRLLWNPPAGLAEMAEHLERIRQLEEALQQLAAER